MKDPKGQVYDYTYNSLGKTTMKSGPEGTYTYIYNLTEGANIGKLIQLNGPNGVTHKYDYGIGDKVNYEERTIGTEVFKTQFQYDNKGRIAVKAFPNNVALAYFYNTNTGSLQSVGRPFATYNTPAGSQVAYLYSIAEENALGQTTKAGYQSQFANGPAGMLPFTFISNTNYNTYGILTGQNTYKQSTNVSPSVTINNYSYDFQSSTGNLLQRKDQKYSLREDFTYDNVNRLTTIQGQNYGPVSSLFGTQNMNYSQNGNVTQKTDAGTFSYDVANRVSEINPYADIPTETQNITYTPFDKIATIEEAQNKAQFMYWADQDRAKMELLENNVLKKTKYYAPNFEKEIDAATGEVRELCYIYGPDDDLVSIIEKKNGVEKTFFVQTDYLGSITQIFDGSGNIIEEKSFDAWGRSRNPQTWAAQPPTGVSNGWDRGYTGQEHLSQFGVVNLNGRLYDPLMGRMMEPDPLIIGEGNSQGYNRYSYALNNPLKYTDPDGHNPLLVAVAIGAAVSAAMYTGTIAASDGGFNNWSWRGFASNVIIGAASGAATYGIGSAFGALSSAAVGSGTKFLVEAGRAAAHGVSSATFAMAGNGGDWDWSSFVAGAAGSAVGSVTNLVPVLRSPVGSLGVSMAVGGMSSSITGGKFLDGAVTAGLVYELNFQLHKENWTLSFTGNAEDVTNDGMTRQMGAGKLSVLDKNGNIIGSYDAISGAGINGLLPNGDYKATRLTMNGGFADETGLDYKIYLDPIGSLAKGFGRSDLRIHPTMHYWSGTKNGAKQYTTLPTDGCVGLVGNKNAAPFLQQMKGYFKTHSSIMLNVNINGNSNVKIQLGNKSHY